MTDAAYIGSWVQRVDAAWVSQSKPHLVDSLVASEPVTRCGRRLRHIEGTAFAYSFEEPAELCRKCKPGGSGG